MKLVRVRKIARHSIKWLNWVIVIPFAILTLLSALLLYTPAGLRLSAMLAEHVVAGLEIGRTEGSILGGHRINDINYQQNGLKVDIKHWQLSLKSRCLLSMQVCIDHLTADGITVNVISGETAKSENATAAILLPIPLSVNELTLKNISADINGNRIDIASFTTSASAWGNKVQLNQPHMQKVLLQLADTAAQPAVPAEPWQYHSPSLRDFSLPLGLFVDQFQLIGLEIVNAGIKQQLSAMQLSMQWQQQQLNITDLSLSHREFSLQAAANINSQNNYPLSANARVTLHGKNITNQTLALQLAGDLANLTLNVQSLGPIDSNITAKLNLLDDALPHQLTVKVTTADLAALSPAATIKLHDSQLDLSGTLQHSKLNSAINVTGEAPLQAHATLEGVVDLSGATLDKLSITALDGNISANAILDWQNGLHWQSNSSLQQIHTAQLMPAYPGQISGELRHSGVLNNDGSWQVEISKLTLEGDIRSHRLLANGTMSANYPADGGGITLFTPELVIQHATNRMQISGSVNHDWQLTAVIDAPELQQSFTGLTGALSGDVAVTGSALQPQLQGKLLAESLRWQDVYLASAELDSKLWLDDRQKINAQLAVQATAGRYQTTRFVRVDLTLDGNEHNHILKINAQAKDHQLQLQLDGTLDEQRSLWQGSLKQALINSALGPWHLPEPMHLSFQLQPQQLRIDQHCWQQRQSMLCLEKPLLLSERSTEFTLALTDFDLATVNGLLPADTSVQGQINAHAQLVMQRGNLPSLRLSIAGESGLLTQQLQTELVFPWHSISLTSQLQDDILTNNLQLQLTDTASFDASVAITQLQQGEQQLSGEIKLRQLAIDFLQPLLGEFSQFQGSLGSNIQVSGTLNSPLLSGDIRLSDAKVKGKQAPTDIENADINVNFSGQQANLTGTITTPNGELKLTGNAAWPTLDAWQANINLTGDALTLQVPNARLQLAPDVNIQLTPELTKLEGTVHIATADINIDSLPQNAVELSDDLVLLDTHLQPIAQQDKTALNMQTDIKVVLGERVKLSAFGLKTHLKGNLRVRQLPKQPLRLNGDVNLLNGTFRAYGQDLLIRKGKMSFNGPSDQPFLSIEAIRNPDNMEDDVIAGIRVDGPADSPSVVVFSEPAKAQANALSYLIMGRDLDSSSGSGGNALTTGLIGMTLASSSKVVGEIGEAFGLKELTLDTAGAGDNSQVTVSGYLSRDLQLKYGYGIFNAVGEFTLRYRLMRRLYLEAVSGVDNAVDLLYKFEFD